MIPGSDGSLQIKWRRIRELSFFVFPDAAPEFLQVFPDGQIAQGLLTNDQQAPSLINWLLAALCLSGCFSKPLGVVSGSASSVLS